MSSSGGVVVVVSPAALIAAGVVFPVLGILTVALQFYTRRLQEAPLMLDDWFLIPGLLLTIGMGASLIVGAEGKALGYPTPYPHTHDLGVILTYVSDEYALSQKIEVAFQLMQAWALGFVKLSILYFYRRIFCTAKSGVFDKVNTIVIGLTMAWTIAFFFALLFKCGTSFYAGWGSILDLQTKCLAHMPLETGLAISDFILDFIILVLPIPQIWSIRLSLSKKIAVTGVFVVGAMAVVASVLRMYIFIIATTTGFDRSVDPDIEITEVLYWSMIESGLAVIAACLPTLQFLFRNFSPDAVLRNIRSMVSLHSLRSDQLQRSRSEHSRHARLHDLENGSRSSQARFGKFMEAGDVESVAMRDEESRGVMPEGRILVSSRVERVEDVV